MMDAQPCPRRDCPVDGATTGNGAATVRIAAVRDLRWAHTSAMVYEVNPELDAWIYSLVPLWWEWQWVGTGYNPDHPAAFTPTPDGRIALVTPHEGPL